MTFNRPYDTFVDNLCVDYKTSKMDLLYLELYLLDDTSVS